MKTILSEIRQINTEIGAQRTIQDSLPFFSVQQMNSILLEMGLLQKKMDLISKGIEKIENM